MASVTHPTLSDSVLAIERDVNLNKHKKDPFLPRYVNLTTSAYNQRDDDSNFDTISRNLRVRTSLITAQLTTLCKELSSVGSEAKNLGEPDARAKAKTTPTLSYRSLLETELSLIATEVSELLHPTHNTTPSGSFSGAGVLISPTTATSDWYCRIATAAVGHPSLGGGGICAENSSAVVSTSGNDSVAMSVTSSLNRLDAAVGCYVSATRQDMPTLMTLQDQSYRQFLKLIRCVDTPKIDWSLTITLLRWLHSLYQIMLTFVDHSHSPARSRPRMMLCMTIAWTLPCRLMTRGI